MYTLHSFVFFFFFFNDTATTEIYTLSLHDALPILLGGSVYKSEGGTPASFKRLLGSGIRPHADAPDRRDDRLGLPLKSGIRMGRPPYHPCLQFPGGQRGSARDQVEIGRAHV